MLWTFAYTEYDGSDLVTTLTDAYGGVTTVQRDTDGSPTAIVGPDGHNTTVTLDADGMLEALTAPDGGEWTVAYDTGGLMTSLTDPVGNETRWTHSSEGRLEQEDLPDGATRTLTRSGDIGDWSVDFETSDGRTNSHAITTNATGAMTRSVADSYGALTTTDVDRDSTTTVTHPDGSVSVTWEADDPIFGAQAPYTAEWSFVTPGGVDSTTSRTLDATQSDRDDPTSVTEWTETTTTLDGNWTRQWTADAAGGSLQTYTPVGRVSSATRDAAGALATLTPAGQDTLTLTRDSRGRITDMSQGSRTSSLLYDATGNLSDVTDLVGEVWSMGYDAVGRPTSLQAPDGGVIELAWDAAGWASGLTTPNGDAYAFSADAEGRNTRVEFPDGAAESRDYDGEGRLTLLTEADGDAVAVSWDLEGRLETVLAGTAKATWAWDTATGLPVSTSLDDGGLVQSQSYAFDGPLPTSVVWTGLVEAELAFEWDDMLRVSAWSLDGDAYALGYDADGLLVSAGELTLSRDQTSGRLAGTSLGTMSSDWSWNEYGELTEVAWDVGGTTIFRESADYVDARITSSEIEQAGSTAVWDWSYDANGRLTGADLDGAAWGTWGYDAAGNRTDEDGVTVASFDSRDRLAVRADTTYTWGADGRLESKTWDDGSGPETTTYSWDPLGNLLGVELPDDTAIAYLVDASGHRIGRTVGGALDRAWLWSGDKVVAEYDGSGALISTFVYGSRPNVPDYLVASGRTWAVVTDLRGSVRAIVDPYTGEIAQEIAYDPWGVVTDDTNPGLQPFGYAGGLYDADTALLRFGVRDYDAEAGRWIAADPIGFSGGWNLYGYVEGDPVSFVDVDGRFAIVLAYPVMVAAEGAFTAWIVPFIVRVAAVYLIGSITSDAPSAVGGTSDAPAGESCENSKVKSNPKVKSDVDELEDLKDAIEEVQEVSDRGRITLEPLGSNPDPNRELATAAERLRRLINGR